MNDDKSKPTDNGLIALGHGVTYGAVATGIGSGLSCIAFGTSGPLIPLFVACGIAVTGLAVAVRADFQQRKQHQTEPPKPR